MTYRGFKTIRHGGTITKIVEVIDDHDGFEYDIVTINDSQLGVDLSSEVLDSVRAYLTEEGWIEMDQQEELNDKVKTPATWVYGLPTEPGYYWMQHKGSSKVIERLYMCGDHLCMGHSKYGEYGQAIISGLDATEWRYMKIAEVEDTSLWPIIDQPSTCQPSPVRVWEVRKASSIKNADWRRHSLHLTKQEAMRHVENWNCLYTVREIEVQGICFVVQDRRDENTIVGVFDSLEVAKSVSASENGFYYRLEEIRTLAPLLVSR